MIKRDSTNGNTKHYDGLILGELYGFILISAMFNYFLFLAQ